MAASAESRLLRETQLLLSMTGQGQGRSQCGAVEITTEVRAVNNRHLKLQTRAAGRLHAVEAQVESLVRSQVKRGSLQLNLQMHGGGADSEYQISAPVLSEYMRQCQQASDSLGVAHDVKLSDLLDLPGVVAEPQNTELTDELKQKTLESVQAAVDCLNQMRKTEGASIATELQSQLSRLKELTDTIEARAPSVVEEYRERLSKRLTKALEEVGAELQEADLVREVLVMADKADVREELVRLRSHFEQFSSLLDSPESQGRKLDFLIQELFRETNTIGSKCGDAEMAQRVVDMKTVIEQMREQVQNVE